MCENPHFSFISKNDLEGNRKIPHAQLVSAVYLCAVGNYCTIRAGLQFETKASALKRLVRSKETDYKVPAEIQAEMTWPQAGTMAGREKRRGRT